MSANFKRNGVLGWREVHSQRPCCQKLHVKINYPSKCPVPPLLVYRIDEHYVIKIADFGLSEDIYSKTYFRQQATAAVKLPVKWMAIESLQEGIFSEKTDIVR